MAVAIALVGLLVAVGQLITGVLALRAPAGSGAGRLGVVAAAQRRWGGLARNRPAIDALLLAAAALLVGSVVLLLLEDRNAHRIHSLTLYRAFVVLGTVLALVAVFFSRLAWWRWLTYQSDTDEMVGVVLAVVLLCLSSVVALFCITDWR